MGDEPRDAEADRATADWSFVAVNPAHSGARYQRPERPLRGVRRSVWFPLIIGVVGWQWTGFMFGPFRAAESGDWLWIVPFYMTAYSVLPAQICLLNLGLLFSPSPFRLRVFIYWLVCSALLVNWYLWLAWAKLLRKETPLIPPEFAQMGVWLPLYVLTLLLPSMLLLFWRWQFVNAQVDDEPAVRRGSFSIRDLMIATAAVAVTLVWYRWLLQAGGGQAISISDKEWLGLWCRTLGVGVAIVPPTLAWLAIRNFNYFLGWFLSLSYSLLVVALGCAVYCWFERFALRFDELFIFEMMALGFALPMVAGLHLLRSFGWRLERRSEKLVHTERAGS